jgi:2-keto-4-pentenoate hydratase/2-oxohepta-3-ene-1,7-dioic acid hydratase in catechol pathway
MARRQWREAPARQHQDHDLDCRHLVWYCSQFFVLEPGDVIITGTRLASASA